MTIKSVNDLRGRRAAVLGLGMRSGVPLVRFLLKQGCSVAVFDEKGPDKLQEQMAALQGTDFELVHGAGYLDSLTGFDYLFRTPIMRPDLPHIERAVREGARLSSEIELVFDLCQAPITAVTGSDGKTTTASLVHAIMKSSGREAWLGGNIGQSLIETVADIPATAEVVLELSSFQLMTMRQSPAVAVMTNLSPNHLDVHRSYDEYIDAKANIWRWQRPQDYVILNYDNDLTRGMANEAAGRILYFSRKSAVPQGVFLHGSQFVARFQDREKTVCSTGDLMLRGVHNWENVAAAICTGLARGISSSDIASGVTRFPGVEHRLELVRILDGVSYYNDSIASSPTRTVAGLNAVGGDIVLIAGGSDKYIAFDSLADELIGKVRAVALIGATAGKIDSALTAAEARSGQVVCRQHFASLRDAVVWCREQARPGGSIMLSPACASFDMFKNFEDRGRQFKDIVLSLPL